MAAPLSRCGTTSTESIDGPNERENTLNFNPNLQTPIMHKNMMMKMSNNNCNQYGIGEDVNNFVTDHEEHDKDREITDSPFNNINISNINPSYSMSSSINSSLTASMNISSFLSLNESNINDISNSNNNEINKTSKVWNDIHSIRDEQFEIKRKMSDFKHALTLWNEGGFIPLFTDFISWINEANIEINTLSQRLTNTTLLFQRFVKKYNAKTKTKQINSTQSKINKDLKFENDALKKENEWLRKQLMDLTSTLSTSHQQIKSIQNKENLNSSKFLEQIDKMENNMINDDEYDSHFKMENVTIFKNLSPEKNEMIYRPKPKKMRLSNSCRTRSTLNSKSKNSNNNTSWKKKLRQQNVTNHSKKKSAKIPFSRSRSYRQSKENKNNISKQNANNKEKTPKSKVISRNNNMKTRRKSEPRPSERNIKSKLNITKNEIKSSKKKKVNNDKTKMIKVNVPKMSTNNNNNSKKSRRSLSTLNISSIRKPSASLRRLSYSNQSNAS